MKKFMSVILVLIFIFGSFSVCSFEAFAVDTIDSLTFTPLTKEQIEVLNSGGRVSAAYKSELPDKISANKAASLPDSFSLSQLGIKTSVGDQGDLGTCWAFSSLTSSETFLLNRGLNTDLSESHLSWFTYSTPNQYKAFEYIFEEYNPFMNGGFDFTAANSLANWYGPVGEKDYPYSDKEIAEENRYDSIAHMQNMISFPEYDYDNDTQQTQAMRELAETVKAQMYKTRQAVDVSYYSYNAASNYNEETNAWYNPIKRGTNHAVTLVGWDDNFPKEKFNNSDSISADGAWLVQNSWGESWGENGYFWLSFEDKTLDYHGIYMYEGPNNYENIYSHDESIQYSPIGFENSNEIFMANVFESKKTEMLEAVSFYTTDIGVKYKVEIYTELTDWENPTSGNLVSSFEGIKDLPGYYTENLPKSVLLNGGEKFSVVVYVLNPTNNLTAQVEAVYMKYRVQSDEDVSGKGESFVSLDGKKWTDIHQKVISGFSEGLAYMRLGNFTIKAFTSSEKFVEFSLDSGEVSFKDDLILSCGKNAEIYYTTDGTDPRINGKLYVSPIKLTDSVKIKATASLDGTFGRVYEREYIQAETFLGKLILSDGETVRDVDLKSSNLGTFVMNYASETVTITASSVFDSIYVNGIKAENGKPLEIPIEEYKYNLLTISVEEDGYKTKTYTAKVFVNPITYDFENEKILFNEDMVSVKTRYHEPVKNAQSVTKWLDSEDYMIFFVEIEDSVEVVPLPERKKLPIFGIDYENECSSTEYGDKVYYKTSADAEFSEENSIENGYLPVFPGETMYIFRKAGDGLFSSGIIEWEIPSRPEIEEVTIEEVKKTRVKLTYHENLIYTCDKEALISFGYFRTLIPGESYVFSAYLPATENTFSSEKYVFEITTDTDDTFTTLQKSIKDAETDKSASVQIKAFFSQIIYSIRLVFVGMFE